MTIIIPTPPTLAGLSPEDLAEFDRKCTLHDFALRAIALQQTEDLKSHQDRMALATEANGAALRAVADKTETGPTLADRKRVAVLDLLGRQARGSRTPAKFVADVQAQVDLAFAAAPGGAAGTPHG